MLPFSFEGESGDNEGEGVLKGQVWGLVSRGRRLTKRVKIREERGGRIPNLTSSRTAMRIERWVIMRKTLRGEKIMMRRKTCPPLPPSLQRVLPVVEQDLHSNRSPFVRNR